MLYTRLNDDGRAFEPQRNLMHRSSTSTAAVRSRPTRRVTSTSPGTPRARMLPRGKRADDSGWPARGTTVRPSPRRRPHRRRDRSLRLLRHQGARRSPRQSLHPVSGGEGQRRARHDAGDLERSGGTLQGDIAATLARQHLPHELRVPLRDALGRPCGVGDEGADRLLPRRSGNPGPFAAGLASRWRESQASGDRRERERGNARRVGRGHRLEPRAARSPGRSSTRRPRRSASQGGSRGASRSGASPPPLPSPTTSSSSSIEAVSPSDAPAVHHGSGRRARGRTGSCARRPTA